MSTAEQNHSSATPPGVVVRGPLAPRFAEILAKYGMSKAALYLGAPTSDMRVQMKIGTVEFDESWVDLRRAWSETSWRMRRLRDDPQCADERHARADEDRHGGV